MGTIGVLGCGTMGEAIAAGLLRNKAPGMNAQNTVSMASVRSERRVAALTERLGCPVVQDNLKVAEHCDLVLLSTKPQVAKDVLDNDSMRQALADKVLVSICAGLRIDQLRAWLPQTRVVRAMPNTPCLIGQGITVVSPGPEATDADVQRTVDIFDSVGRVRTLDEKHLDAVTGLSGSGPAFVCVILEALADGGVRMGLPRDVATELAAQTAVGAAQMVLQTGRHPAALKDEVTTPAGCTIAGLLMMEDGRIRSTLARTIEEATKTASGLGQSR